MAHDDRRVNIGEDAIGNAIISGDGNIVIVQTVHERKVDEPPAVPADSELGPNPYVGLSAFHEEDANRFFGREKLVGRLWERLRDLQQAGGGDTLRLLPILGPSGSGKSSLARAGLIPELARRPLPGLRQARVAVFTPGSHPLEALAAILARIATGDKTPVAKTREFATELCYPGENDEYNGLRRIADVLPDISDAPLVVFVDQFEEVYSMCEDRTERKAFVENLLTAAGDKSGHVTVIFTLRSDFLRETQEHLKLNTAISVAGMIVPAMSEAELREAIARPAREAGHELDEATVQLLVSEVAGREGALPLLQFALTRIWEGLSEGSTPAETLKQIGGVGGALAGEAERIFNGLSESDQTIARRAFLSMVQLGEGTRDTRRRVSLDQLVTYADSFEQVEAVIRRFSHAGARLVTLSSNDAGADTAEVTHESLFEHWEQLNTWLEAGRDDIRFHRRLAEAARNWVAHGRPEGSLWRPPDLDLLQAFQERTPGELTQAEMEFYAAAVEAEQNRLREKQRQQVRLRRTAIIAVSVACVAMVSSGTAVWMKFVADQQTEIAEESRIGAREAKSAAKKAQTAQEAALAASAAALTKEEQARAAKIAAERYLASNYIMRGMDAIDDGDDARGVSQFFAAYRTGRSREHEPFPSAARNLIAGWSMQLGKPVLHDGPVRAVAISPDGKTVLTGSEDRTARLWNAADGKPRGKPMRHQGPVRAVAFSSDGKTVLTGSLDRTARLWDASTGEPIGQPLRLQSPVIAVAFSPDCKTVLTGTLDKTARLWDAVTGKPRGKPLKHPDRVSAVAFSPDGKTVLTGCWDYKARLWDAATGAPRGKPMQHKAPVLAVAFGPEGKSVLTGSADNTARLWDVATGKPRGKAMSHQNWVRAVAFSSDGKTVLTGSDDNTARLWDADSGAPRGQPIRRPGRVFAVAFSPDGKTVLTGSSDNTARLMDALCCKPLRHQGPILAVAFSRPHGKTVLTGSADNTARLWNASTGQLRCPPLHHQGPVLAVAFSPDGNSVLTGSADKTARLWDAYTGQPRGQPLQHRGPVLAVAFSSDGKTVLTGSADNTARLWDAFTGRPLGRPLEHRGPVAAVAFSSDGKTALTGSDDSTAKLWNASTGEQLGKTMQHQGAALAVAFSPDGTTALTGSEDKTAQLWDATTGEPRGRTMRHPARVGAVTFSPDGKTVLTGCADNVARLWDGSTGELRGQTLQRERPLFDVALSPDVNLAPTGNSGLVGPMRETQVTAPLWDVSTGESDAQPVRRPAPDLVVAFSPDGKTVLTGSRDGTARLWDVASGEQRGETIRHRGPVNAVAFSPDKKTILTAGDDKTAWLWGGVPQAALDEPERLRLSVEVRSGYQFDDRQGIPRRMTQKQWLEQRQELYEKHPGGFCDKGDSVRPGGG